LTLGSPIGSNSNLDLKESLEIYLSPVVPGTISESLNGWSEVLMVGLAVKTKVVNG